MVQAHNNAFSPVSTVKINANDWQRMPAWFKSHRDGVACILSNANGKAAFIPVEIIH